MIDLHYAPTPNGWKISIMLEELGLPYKVIPVNIRAGEQFRPEFLAISPNNRIPAIVDHAPSDGGEPFSVFETGAILIYLADKTGRFLPTEMRGRSGVIQWVMWQMGGLGPMLGQHGHFALYAAEKIPYAIERYRDEAARLYRVLDTQLGKTGAYVAGDYSIADIACFPWTMTHKAQGFTLDDYPNIKRWYAEVRARPQVQAGLAIGKFVKEPFDEEARQEHVRADARRSWRGKGNSPVVIASEGLREAPRDDRLRKRSIAPSVENGSLRLAALPAMTAETKHKSQSKRKRHDRILLRLFQSLDLSRLPQHPAARKGVRRRDFVAADPGRRHLQYRQSQRLCPARDAGAAEGALHEEGSRRLGALGGLAIKMPPTVFPVNSVKAMRGCIWLGKDMVPFARAVFETYWGGDKDISQDAVLTEICKRVGVDPQNSLPASASRRSRTSSRPIPMR